MVVDINCEVIAYAGYENLYEIKNIKESNLLDLYSNTEKYKEYISYSDDNYKNYMTNITFIYPKINQFILASSIYAKEINYTKKSAIVYCKGGYLTNQKINEYKSKKEE